MVECFLEYKGGKGGDRGMVDRCDRRSGSELGGGIGTEGKKGKSDYYKGPRTRAWPWRELNGKGDPVK